jgi:hypothetical protein
MEQIDAQYLATHEAGHCVVARAFGATVTFSTIDPAKSYGMFGRTDIEFVEGLPRRKAARRKIASFLAGQAANDRQSGDPYFSMGFPDLEARHRGPDLLNRPWLATGNDLQRALNVAVSAVPTYSDSFPELIVGRRMAELLLSVSLRWKLVQRVADALETDLSIDEERIDDLLG